MRTEILIWIQLGSEKCRSKALKVAAAVRGVESVTVAGEERNLLLVIGDGVDASRLTRKLRSQVGYAEIVELTTSTREREAAAPGAQVVVTTTTQDTARPRYQHGRGGLPWLAHAMCPVTVHSAAHPAAPVHMASTITGHMTYSAPSPCYHCSPLAVGMPVRGGGTSGYALEVARSHPANYSPMIERHGRRYPTNSYFGKAHRGEPSCCSVQ